MDISCLLILLTSQKKNYFYTQLILIPFLVVWSVALIRTTNFRHCYPSDNRFIQWMHRNWTQNFLHFLGFRFYLNGKLSAGEFSLFVKLFLFCYEARGIELFDSLSLNRILEIWRNLGLDNYFSFVDIKLS